MSGAEQRVNQFLAADVVGGRTAVVIKRVPHERPMNFRLTYVNRTRDRSGTRIGRGWALHAAFHIRDKTETTDDDDDDATAAGVIYRDIIDLCLR